MPVDGEKTMRLRTGIAALAVIFGLSASAPAGAASRIKDLANIEGVRQNQLIGYGLVVGLNGTGDTLNNIPFTKQSLQAMLERLGVNIRGQTLRTGNVAAVMVTANLPRLRHAGHAHRRHRLGAGRRRRACRAARCWSRRCSAPTAMSTRSAQGSLAIAGFQAEGDAAKITRGVPTVGRISNGAIIEREIDFALNRLPQPAARAAQCRLHHRQAHRRRDQRLHRHRRPPSRSIPRPCSSPSRRSSTATWSRC